ncbi:hypothetical protein BH10ACT6_BH10ACT6_07330 [soil metagenome]
MHSPSPRRRLLSALATAALVGGSLLLAAPAFAAPSVVSNSSSVYSGDNAVPTPDLTGAQLDTLAVPDEPRQTAPQGTAAGSSAIKAERTGFSAPAWIWAFVVIVAGFLIAPSIIMVRRKQAHDF